MNRKLIIWYDNALLLIGLVRTKRYVELMDRYKRLSAQYEVVTDAQRTGPSRIAVSW